MDNSLINNLLEKMKNVENFTYNFGLGLIFLSILQGLNWINLSSSFMLGLSVTGLALAFKEVRDFVDINKVRKENIINNVFNFIINFMPVLGILVIPNLKIVQDLSSNIIGYYSNNFTLIGLGITLSTISQKSKNELFNTVHVFIAEMTKISQDSIATAGELREEIKKIKSQIDNVEKK